MRWRLGARYEETVYHVQAITIAAGCKWLQQCRSLPVLSRYKSIVNFLLVFFVLNDFRLIKERLNVCTLIMTFHVPREALP